LAVAFVLLHVVSVVSVPEELLRNAHGSRNGYAGGDAGNDLLAGGHAFIFVLVVHLGLHSSLAGSAPAVRLVERFDEARDDPVADDLGPVRGEVLAGGGRCVLGRGEQRIARRVPAARQD